MTTQHERGPVNLAAIAALLGLIIAGVWVWKRLPLDTQTYIIDQALPLAAGGLAVGLIILAAMRKVRRRVLRRRERDRLIASFQRETEPDKKLDLSFALIEGNAYRTEGLASIIPELKALWETTLCQALGDERHRIRGMAASHLGLLQDTSVVPPLIKALEDDHPYVRSCAALGLGRLRAVEARERLSQVAKDDGDQSVRGRAREALDRIRV
jgi:hypothetical protein